MEISPSLSRVADSARNGFRQRFGRLPQWIVAAPGRVNLIGEHTDYNEGFVLPMAIDRYVVLAAARASGTGNALRIASDWANDEHTIHVGRSAGLPKWCAYVHGVCDLLGRRGLETGPLDALLVSTAPVGGGLASSAALTVATATLVEATTGVELEGRDKAQVCQSAENVYVGMPCGIMDQMSSAMSQPDEAMLLDCRTLAIAPVPLQDPEVSILIINSGVKHELSASEYPLRRTQCADAARALGLSSLRDASLQLLHAYGGSLSEVGLRRARHVVSENERVHDFSDAARAGDWRRAGALMYASHASLRDDFEVSCVELDALVDHARALGETAGVFGSRMTGGGFGGCTVTLCQTEAMPAIAERILEAYRQSFGIAAQAFTSRPARGAHQLSPR